MPGSASPATIRSLLPSALSKEDSQDSTATQKPRSPLATYPIATLPPFSSFFTLIEDAHSATTHHPKVHYIFSDDDSDLLTDAALHIHDSQASKSSSRTQSQQQSVNERYIVVTLDATGTGVESAHSLTGDWQVLSTEIGMAPTLEGEGEKEGLMLRIEGTEGVRGPGEVEELGMEALVELFGRRMGELQRVVEGAGGL